jgi:hypothetical protein
MAVTMLCHVFLVRTDVSEECMEDDGGNMFLRNVSSYKSHMA